MAINNYEEEIIHDILYEAREKGYIIDLRVFEMALPMIMGFNEARRYSGTFLLSELNFLQSYHIFGSIKRIIILNGMRVVQVEKHKQLLFACICAAKEYATRYDGLKNDFQEECGGMQLLNSLYGLRDGRVRSRREFAPRHCVNIAECEMVYLKRILSPWFKQINAKW